LRALKSSRNASPSEPLYSFVNTAMGPVVTDPGYLNGTIPRNTF
jgi:hypothetical protein